MTTKNSTMRIYSKYGLCGSLVFACLVLASTVIAKEHYLPYVDQAYPSSVYWGDTHLHTNLSVDANITGNRNLSPVYVNRLALGELNTDTGQRLYKVYQIQKSDISMSPQVMANKPDVIHI